MKIHKKLLLITFSILMLISCKKEKLEGDSAILIGKWKATKFVKTIEYFSDCSEKIDNCISRTIEFKKNKNKVIVKEGGNKTKFTVKIDEIVDLTNKKEFTYFYACSSPKLDSINSSFRIYPIFSYDEEERESSTTYYVNDDKLIVYTRRYSKSSGDFMGVNIYFYERIE